MKEHRRTGQVAAPIPAPDDLPLEDWTVQHHLARIQAPHARRAARPLGVRRPKAVDVETTEPAPGVRVERGMVANPAGRPMVATFVKVASPDIDHDVVERELRRSRSIVARAGSIASARRPRCQPGRRRGSGRPARRPSRTTSRSSAAGDSGPGDSDEPGDAGHLTLAPSTATHTRAALAPRQGRRA